MRDRELECYCVDFTQVQGTLSQTGATADCSIFQAARTPLSSIHSKKEREKETFSQQEDMTFSLSLHPAPLARSRITQPSLNHGSSLNYVAGNLCGIGN